MYYCIRLFIYILDFYYLFLIANVILSWLPFLYKYKFFRFIGFIGDLFLEPFTNLIVIGPIDFTPIIGFGIYSGFWTLLNYLLV